MYVSHLSVWYVISTQPSKQCLYRFKCLVCTVDATIETVLISLASPLSPFFVPFFCFPCTIFLFLIISQRVFSLDESLELLDDADLMWGPLRTSTVTDNGNITLWPETSNGSVASSSRGSPPPGNHHALVNFERGAALASAVALGSCRNGGGGGGADVETGGYGDIDLQGLLLGESDSHLENLSFDIMRGETAMAAAAASTNSGNKADNVFWFSGASRGGAGSGGGTSVVALSPSSVPRTVGS